MEMKQKSSTSIFRPMTPPPDYESDDGLQPSRYHLRSQTSPRKFRKLDEFFGRTNCDSHANITYLPPQGARIHRGSLIHIKDRSGTNSPQDSDAHNRIMLVLVGDDADHIQCLPIFKGQVSQQISEDSHKIFYDKRLSNQSTRNMVVPPEQILVDYGCTNCTQVGGIYVDTGRSYYIPSDVEVVQIGFVSEEDMDVLCADLIRAQVNSLFGVRSPRSASNSSAIAQRKRQSVLDTISSIHSGLEKNFGCGNSFTPSPEQIPRIGKYVHTPERDQDDSPGPINKPTRSKRKAEKVIKGESGHKYFERSTRKR